jgi:tyrosinase
LEALSECPYELQGSDPGFCQDLDFGLHGNVHVLVGDTQNMGSVPWAARDPIFWMHHCNIDRLWASWNAAGRKNPALSETFVFADEKGQRVVAEVQDFMDIAKLGYAYDRLEEVPDCPPRPVFLAAAQNQKRRATVRATPVALGADPVQVTLEPLPEREGEVPVHLPNRVKSLEAERRLYLIVRDLRAETQPGVLYHVYLELPSGASREQLEAHHVGVLNFFHAVGHGEHGHGGEARKETERFLRFDITNLVKALQSKNLLRDKPTLTIAPVGRPAADAKPVIGEITLVEQ